MLRIKSHLALIPLLLLSKPDPLRWAPVLFFQVRYELSYQESQAPCGLGFLGIGLDEERSVDPWTRRSFFAGSAQNPLFLLAETHFL
ncbi:MAG: hypothetical protein IK095_07850 [Oscillospiraceae bacterium]|nr:hypothetical protein [Oscillospiraceae bacterium]